MRKGQTICDSNLLDRFFDQELEPDEYTRFSKHLKHCPACQNALRDNQSISSLLKTGLDKELSRTNLEEVEERVLALIRKGRTAWWIKHKHFLVSKKFYVPVTAAATALVLFLSLARHPVPAPSPSAIVQSFDGNVASVMILETRKSHQTVLWYTETLDLDNEDSKSEKNQSGV